MSYEHRVSLDLDAGELGILENALLSLMWQIANRDPLVTQYERQRGDIAQLALDIRSIRERVDEARAEAVRADHDEANVQTIIVALDRLDIDLSVSRLEARQLLTLNGIGCRSSVLANAIRRRRERETAS